ncbi:MAG: ribosomal protein S17 [Desulfomicrobium escambiense]|nr:ribosomal protein S17 [Desulfomicrobium escambiense]
MDKTVVVTVERLEKHPVFEKYHSQAHEVQGSRRDATSARPGDKVLIGRVQAHQQGQAAGGLSKILERQEQ